MGTFLLLLAMVFTCCSLASSTDGSVNLRGMYTSQALILDAGSSGTRIHVFNMRTNKGGEQVPAVDLTVRAKQTLKLKPGLSSFAESRDYGACETSMKQLIDFANGFVPESRRALTPVLLKATAGLRSVSHEAAEEVLKVVRKTLSTSGYAFQPEWADIIAGKEEGGLAWVAANYLRGTFSGSPSAQSSVGVIEMGGGSSQVSFEVDEKTPLVEQDHFRFTTATGKIHHVYAHSYLGFGQDHAQRHYHERFVGSSDPCYPKGYIRKRKDSGQIDGAGHATNCIASIRSLLIEEHKDAPGAYAHEQLLSGALVATENFFYVQSNGNFGLTDAQVEPSDMERAAEAACSQDLQLTAEESAKMSGGSADAAEPKTCFALSYQSLLLKQLRVERPRTDVKIVHQINGADVDWALGAALIHHLEFSRSRSSSFAQPDTTSIFASIFTLMLLFTMFLLGKTVYSRLFGAGVKTSARLPAFTKVNKACVGAALE